MKTKTENPIEEIWRIRDELTAEEGNDHTQAIPPGGRHGEDPTQRWG